MKNPERPAFSYTDGSTFAYDGLSKREYFAGLAMQGILANNAQYLHGNKDGQPVYSEVAKEAVEAADELLKLLGEPK